MVANLLPAQDFLTNRAKLSFIYRTRRSEASGGQYEALKPAIDRSLASPINDQVTNIGNAVAITWRTFQDSKSMASRCDRTSMMIRTCGVFDQHYEELATLDISAPVSCIMEVGADDC